MERSSIREAPGAIPIHFKFCRSKKQQQFSFLLWRQLKKCLGFSVESLERTTVGTAIHISGDRKTGRKFELSTAETSVRR
ncbi:hypothetical protein MRB53_026381 [Persea americana]|uniref:Uncharacterized protein n=1 Tax=Persea americana TaxID=3435 RepID=A0ACC2LHV9_PERAE|nr:hypothetical protein MRB53_026381 [Persea americana]